MTSGKSKLCVRCGLPMTVTRDQAMAQVLAYESKHYRALAYRDHNADAVFEHRVGSLPCNQRYELRCAQAEGLERVAFSAGRQTLLQTAQLINPTIKFRCFLETVGKVSQHVLYVPPRISDAVTAYRLDDDLSGAVLRKVLHAFDPEMCDELLLSYEARKTLRMLGVPEEAAPLAVDESIAYPVTDNPKGNRW